MRVTPCFRDARRRAISSSRSGSQTRAQTCLPLPSSHLVLVSPSDQQPPSPEEMVVLNKMDLRDHSGSSGGSSSGGRGTPGRSSGRNASRSNGAAGLHSSSSVDNSVADVIACATGYSMESLGRKLSNDLLVSSHPSSTRAAAQQLQSQPLDQLFHSNHPHQQQQQQSHSRVNQNGKLNGAGGSRFQQPLSLIRAHDVHECMDDEESLSTQTPVYEAIDPSRLTR